MTIFGLVTRGEQDGSALLAVWIIAASIAFGQTKAAAETPLTFEVASIKLHTGLLRYSEDPKVQGERVIGTASTVLEMVANAYGVRRDQVLGGPSWVREDRYDVDAKAPGDTPLTTERAKLMMRTLLTDRFSLGVRREMKEVPTYSLLMGKGLKIKEVDPNTPLAVPVVLGKPSGLHMQGMWSMPALAKQLSSSAGRPVLDKTGLPGQYQLTLDWFPENPAGWFPPTRTPSDSDFPSMFSAIQELGLKLESSKDQQEMLIIDRVEKPSAN